MEEAARGRTAPVNKIIPFSAVDGPGNRTALFLQGCNFDCRYCHNPETRNLCTGCGACVSQCPNGALYQVEGEVRFRPERCCGCDTCIRTCRFGCSPRICNMTAEEAYARVKRQIPYIRGVTVSGGECTLYPEFLTELFALCRKAGLGTLADSNGSLDFEQYPDLLEQLDGVMLDVKAWTAEDHRAVTGVSNEMVLKNLEFLARKGKLHEIRTVIVPGMYDCAGTVRAAALAAAAFQDRGRTGYRLIAWRPMGVRKEYADYRTPTGALMEEMAEIARAAGMKKVITV